MPIKYLSAAGVARHLGLSVNTIQSYAGKGMLPPPDAVIISKAAKEINVWLPETIDQWQSARPRAKQQKEPQP